MATVDTLKAYELLTAAKVPEEQARAILEVVGASQASGLDNLITRGEFKEEMLTLRAEIKELEVRLLKWFIILLLGQGGLVVALLKILK